MLRECAGRQRELNHRRKLAIQAVWPKRRAIFRKRLLIILRREHCARLHDQIALALVARAIDRGVDAEPGDFVDLAVVRRLLAAGAATNLRDRDRFTAADVATARSFSAIVAQLQTE